MESSPSSSLEMILVLGWQQTKLLAEVEGSVRYQRSRSLEETHSIRKRKYAIKKKVPSYYTNTYPMQKR